MGFLLIADNSSRTPETVGQKLDRELREQRDTHERQIRDLEQRLESLKRRQTLGL